MKKKLNEIYKNLNPSELKKKIAELQEELFKVVRKKMLYERNWKRRSFCIEKLIKQQGYLLRIEKLLFLP